MDVGFIYQEYAITILLGIVAVVTAHLSVRYLITHRVPQNAYAHMAGAFSKGADAIKKKMGEKKRQKELLEDLKQRSGEPQSKTKEIQKAPHAKQADYI